MIRILGLIVLLLCTSVVRCSATIPVADHIYVIMEENTRYDQVVGNPNWTYLNQLIGVGGLATQYYANFHPSLPNYLELVTGSNDGVTRDICYNSIPPITADNIVRELNAKRLSWHGYFEGLPTVGSMVCNSGYYAGRHNPLVYLSDVRNSVAQQQQMIPFSRFATDLASNVTARWNMLVPNVCNDNHGDSRCTNGCTAGNSATCQKIADNWLKFYVGKILSQPDFQAGGHGMLHILFDESAGDSLHGGGRVVSLLVGPTVKDNYKSTTFYQEQSALRLWLEALGVFVWPGAAKTALSMMEFF